MDYYNNDYDSSQNELYNTVRAFLHPDEQVLWLGKPCQSAKPPVSPFSLIFAFFWLGFAVFWTVTATASGGAFGLFGLPFLAVGIYFVYTLVIGQRKRLSGTVYVVTDRRAMIVYNSVHGMSCNEYYFNNMTSVSLTQVKGNVGTVCFEQPYDGYYRHGGRVTYRSKPIDHDMQTSFILIDDVHTVYQMISERISGK